MKQSADKYMEIGRSMMEYFKRFKGFVRSELSEHDLNFAEVFTMLSLYGVKEQTAEKLLESISYDKSVMTRTLQSLEKKDIVRRRKNENDGRSWLFELTDNGMAKMELVFPVLLSWSELAFEGFEDEEIDSMLRYLNRLKSNMSK